MPSIDISKIQYKLIGVCTLKNEERDLLKSIWSERFSEQTAFFVDVQQEDSTLAMAQKIYSAISQAGYTSASGFQVILAMFVDLRSAMDDAYMQTISGLSSQLSAWLHCSIKLQLLFGFCGTRGLKAGEDVAQMRQSVMALAERNPYAKGVYLVGEPVFGGAPEFRWKAVCLYLDLLRRNATTQRLQTVSHEHGTVGFLRYGEYDEQLLMKLSELEKLLIHNLGSYGHVEFPGELNKKLTKIESETRESFAVDANTQPIHPDMIVTGMWNIYKAKRNSNDEFNRGRAQTLAALRETGDNIVQQVQAFYEQQMGDPRKFLVDIFIEIHAGIGFVENRAAMQSLLKHQIQPMQDAMPPALAYNEKGYSEEIQTYLTQKLNYGIYKAKLWCYETLNRVYENLSEQKIEKERTLMQEKLHMVQNNLTHVPTKKEFCELSIGHGDNLDAQFMAIVGASGDMTLKHLVCRKEEDRVWIESNCRIGNQQEARFFIHESMGGLLTLDEAPIKAVQALLFDCSEMRLKELLGM